MHSSPRRGLRIYVDEHEAPYRFGVFFVQGHLPAVHATRQELEHLRSAGKLKHAQRDAKDKYRLPHVSALRNAIAELLRHPPTGLRAFTVSTRCKATLLTELAGNLDREAEQHGRLICDPMSWSGHEKEARSAFLLEYSFAYEEHPKDSQEVWLTAIDYALFFKLL